MALIKLIINTGQKIYTNYSKNILNCIKIDICKEKIGTIFKRHIKISHHIYAREFYLRPIVNKLGSQKGLEYLSC